MDSLLLSRITKDFFNLDPDLVPEKERYRMGWGGSVLAPHPKAPPVSKEKKAIALLLALRNRFAALFENPTPAPLPPSPRLPRPSLPEAGNLQPPQYFSRGALESNLRKNPRPIPYLLTESHEMAKARPVPGNSFMLRSLCKGKGTLKQNKQGLIYLDVDNRFISMMLPYLKAQGLARPPYFNLFGDPEGAHVPVVPAREAAFQFLEEVKEIGQEFSFEIEGLYSVQPDTWPEVEQVWFFKLQSVELEDLRRRYFLPGTPGGHGFQIAVAVKPVVTATEIPRPIPLMRVNPSFIAA